MNAVQVTVETLNTFTKPVLIEMARVLTGKVGDSARTDKVKYVEALSVFGAEELTTAYEQATAANSDDDAAARKLVEALNLLVKPQAKAPQMDEAKVAQMIEQAKDMIGAEVEADMDSKLTALRAELADMTQKVAEAAAATPRVEKLVVAQGIERKVEGRTHAMFDKVCKLAAIRKNVLLVGPAGAGKTKLAHQVADALGLPFYSISCTAGMSETHLTGWLLPVGESGRFVYVPSMFVTAYEQGGVFLLDEGDAADANVLMVLNQALANGGFFIPQRTEKPYCKRHADFVCIMAANTFGHGGDMVYAGRERLDGATLDRFRSGIVSIEYDADLEEALVDPDVLAWGRAIRETINASKLRRIMSTRLMIDFSDQKTAYGWGRTEWTESYFRDWTRDELNKANQG